MADEGEKYPPKIQKLFAPRLPLLYKKPIDQPPERRLSHLITLLKNWKLHIDQYKAQYGQTLSTSPKSVSKKEQVGNSYRRQLIEWEDPDALSENQILKDPYRTVFVARLYYSMTELDLTKAFGHYGSIESVRIIRHVETGASRGYGFIVFDREADAKNCIRELAPTGLSTDPPPGSSLSRKILVDMERGRLIRNWRPRRLGGGLGGRHYTLPSALHSKDASAAASGRRFNLLQNPYQPSTSANSASRFPKRPHPDRYTSPSVKRQATNSDHYASSEQRTPLVSSYAPTSLGSSLNSTRVADASVKDKYAKYQTVGSQQAATSGRSIRSIRERE